MNQEDIDHFLLYGYVVIPFFTEEEIADMRQDLHNTLGIHGINHQSILSGTGADMSISVLDKVRSTIFYLETKMKAHQRLHDVSKALMNATYSSGQVAGFTHPLGSSTEVLPFIDHIAYRLPDHIRAEGGLQMHIDRNPHIPYGGKYFRPIQSWIALTDHYGGESGGLQLVPGFHLQYDDFFREWIKTHPAEKGGFFRMHGRSYSAVQKRLVPIDVPAGSVVYWDHRLPHATCSKLTSYDSREIFLFSYIPAVAINQEYYQKQSDNMKHGLAPPFRNDP